MRHLFQTIALCLKQLKLESWEQAKPHTSISMVRLTFTWDCLQSCNLTFPLLHLLIGLHVFFISSSPDKSYLFTQLSHLFTLAHKKLCTTLKRDIFTFAFTFSLLAACYRNFLGLVKSFLENKAFPTGSSENGCF